MPEVNTPWGSTRTSFQESQVVEDVLSYLNGNQPVHANPNTVRKWMREFGLARTAKDAMRKAQDGDITDYLQLARDLESEGLSPREVDEKLLLHWCP